MFIYYLGHACMKICNRKYSVLFDPYEPGSVPGLPDLKAQATRVLSSHGHHDHDWIDGVEVLSPIGPAFKITEIKSYHDDRQGALRGENTIHVVEADGLRIVHMGDQGCMPTDEQFELIGQPDCIMIPVGGHYTVDAAAAKAICDRCGARVIIPMHYRGDGFGYDVIAPVSEFEKLFPKGFVREYDSDTLELTKDTPPHVAVLTSKK